MAKQRLKPSGLLPPAPFEQPDIYGAAVGIPERQAGTDPGDSDRRTERTQTGEQEHRGVLRAGSPVGIAGNGFGKLGLGIIARVGMIGESSVIWLAVAPVDMRRGIDGLSMVVQQALGHAPGSGMAFVFRNKAGNRLRLLVWDGNGVWLCHRRLHRGGFVWPKVTDVSFCINRAQWDWLVSGVDWQRLSRLPNPDWQV